MAETLKVRFERLKRAMGTPRQKATWADVAFVVGYTTVSIRSWRSGDAVPSKRALKAIRDVEERYK